MEKNVYNHSSPGTQKLIKKISSPWGFRAFGFKYIPILWFSRASIQEISEGKIRVKLPFRWSTKNPFKSVYFAAQASAAEISTGLAFYFPARHYGNISMLVKEMHVVFHKKAKTDLIFECKQIKEIAEFVDSVSRDSEGREFTAKSVGYDKENNIVSEFNFVWTLKSRN